VLTPVEGGGQILTFNEPVEDEDTLDPQKDLELVRRIAAEFAAFDSGLRALSGRKETK
jgi:hypothetical protein